MSYKRGPRPAVPARGHCQWGPVPRGICGPGRLPKLPGAGFHVVSAICEALGGLFTNEGPLEFLPPQRFSRRAGFRKIQLPERQRPAGGAKLSLRASGGPPKGDRLQMRWRMKMFGLFGPWLCLQKRDVTLKQASATFTASPVGLFKKRWPRIEHRHDTP